MRLSLPLVAIASAITACAAPQTLAQAEAPARAPNILVILVDDLGARDLGYSGSVFHETPEIDQLAAEGIDFTNAYAAFPRCVPSRHAFFTGRNPARAQVPGGRGGESLGTEVVTVAEAMQEADYTTFFAGKWHLGREADEMPDAQGFDINIGGGSAGAVATHFFPYGAENRRSIGPGLKQGEEGEYLTDRLTDETVAFLESHVASGSDRPFFAVLSHYAVHTPIEAPAELVEYYESKLDRMEEPDRPQLIERDGETQLIQNDPVYAAMVTSVDQSVGDLRAALDRLGVAEDTIIIFTSDHGGLSNRGLGRGRRLPTSNWPLRAGKGHIYEGGVRVPFLAAWPGHLDGGVTSPTIVNNTDLFPTFLSLAGLPLRPDWHRDGNPIAAIAGGEQVSSPIYWYNPRPRVQSTGDRASAAIRDGDWKYVLSFDPAVPSELFDLSEDPGENNDLSGRYPQRAADMRGQLENYLNEIDAVAPSLDRRGREPVPGVSFGN
ncbi:sulfatase [Aurantiacibacter sp. MUD61]|uniref:sulfatase n=1 Tax=Aurantiacibacter sp. MUD61 TaxID=3009083 RepID=UPI0022F119F6|nr:sulfatase [Aurantiacibacter sp. MUD61]